MIVDSTKKFYFKKICDYIFEYDFPITDYFYPYVNNIVENYFQNLDESKGYNVIFENSFLLEHAEKFFLQLIEKEFCVSEKTNQVKLWTYCQNNTFSRNIFHNHINTSTIAGVFYMNLPSHGGELEYIIGNNRFHFIPSPNKIYVFPHYLYHRPMAQKDKDWRVCINLEYLCRSRAIHKSTRILW